MALTDHYGNIVEPIKAAQDIISSFADALDNGHLLKSDLEDAAIVSYDMVSIVYRERGATNEDLSEFLRQLAVLVPEYKKTLWE